MDKPMMFPKWDHVRIVVPPRDSWHLSKRYRTHDGIVAQVSDHVLVTKGKGESTRHRWYYKLDGHGGVKFPIPFVRAVFDYKGEHKITRELIDANKVSWELTRQW